MDNEVKTIVKSIYSGQPVSQEYAFNVFCEHTDALPEIMVSLPLLKDYGNFLLNTDVMKNTNMMRLLIEMSKLSFSFAMWRAPTRYGLLQRLGTWEPINNHDDKTLGHSFLSPDKKVIMRRSYLVSTVGDYTLYIQNMSEHYGRDLLDFYIGFSRAQDKPKIGLPVDMISWKNIQDKDIYPLMMCVEQAIHHRHKMWKDIFMTQKEDIDNILKSNEYSVYENHGLSWFTKKDGKYPIISASPCGDFPWKKSMEIC